MKVWKGIKDIKDIKELKDGDVIRRKGSNRTWTIWAIAWEDKRIEIYKNEGKPLSRTLRFDVAVKDWEVWNNKGGAEMKKEKGIVVKMTPEGNEILPYGEYIEREEDGRHYLYDANGEVVAVADDEEGYRVVDPTPEAIEFAVKDLMSCWGFYPDDEVVQKDIEELVSEFELWKDFYTGKEK